jgi:hypothetical protein
MTPSGRVYDEWLERDELRAVKDGKASIERRTTWPPQFPHDPRVRETTESVEPLPALPRDFEVEGEHDLEIAGRTIRCVVITSKPPASRDRRWIAKDASNLTRAVVKREAELHGEVEEVIAWDEEIQVPAGKMRCVRVRMAREGSRRGEREVFTYWESLQVPNGVVKSTYGIHDKEGKVVYDQVDELEGFELKP